MRSKRHKNAGMALVLVMLASIVILGAVMLVVSRAVSEQRFTDMAVDRALLEEVCRAGIEVGIYQVWGSYLESQDDGPGNLATYRDFMDGWSSPMQPVSGQNPFVLEGVGEVVDVTISWEDDLTGTDYVVAATGRVGNSEMTVQQTLRVSGERFEGFEYAVLANNINCILCHARFLPLDLEYNLDSDLYGTFDRIKVASLESLMVRPSEARSHVAGTVYTRGRVYDDRGRALSASALASSSFNSYAFDDASGRVEQDTSTGNKVLASLQDADTDGDGLLDRYANLYQDYPTEREFMTDGYLPESFPSPFPDENGNRLVDDAEFIPVMNSANGSLSGGVIHGVPRGQLYTGDALPTASNAAVTPSGGAYDGNMVLVGSENDPINIDGAIAINGDLVISGPVKGKGRLLVRGNVYIVGDVTYADAPGEFGVAADGTENALAVASGGSILMGDYLTVRGKNNTNDTSKYPDWTYSIDVRQEHVSRNKRVGGETQRLDYGYFDPGAVDAGELSPTMLDADGNEVPRQGQQFSFTTSELMLFNRMEYQKAQEDPNYVPRYYGLRADQPDLVYIYDSPDEHSVRYDESGGGVKLLTDYANDPNILDRGVVHYMNPSGNWIGEETLRRIWWDDEMSRPSSGRPFQFDGLLYSNNSIFAITRSRTRHKSHTDGKMTIRGAIISADLGVLVPSNANANDIGLTLLYDRRVPQFLTVEDTSQVSFRRLVYSMAEN